MSEIAKESYLTITQNILQWFEHVLCLYFIEQKIFEMILESGLIKILLKIKFKLI